jgi:hypothetical protein
MTCQGSPESAQGVGRRPRAPSRRLHPLIRADSADACRMVVIRMELLGTRVAGRLEGPHRRTRVLLTGCCCRRRGALRSGGHLLADGPDEAQQLEGDGGHHLGFEFSLAREGPIADTKVDVGPARPLPARWGAGPASAAAAPDTPGAPAIGPGGIDEDAAKMGIAGLGGRVAT